MKYLMSCSLLCGVMACSGGGGAGTVDGAAATGPASGGGKSVISLGVPVSGTIDDTDHSWYVIGPPPAHGYQDTYQIDVTAGTTYTVKCTSDFVEVEDADAFGEFTDAKRVSSVGLECMASPATWLPLRTGTATINVLALWDDVPTSYSVTFSK